MSIFSYALCILTLYSHVNAQNSTNSTLSVNGTFNSAINSTDYSAVNSTDYSAVNSTLNSTDSSTLNSTMNSTTNSTDYSAINSTLNSTDNSKNSSSIDGTVKGFSSNNSSSFNTSSVNNVNSPYSSAKPVGTSYQSLPSLVPLVTTTKSRTTAYYVPPMTTSYSPVPVYTTFSQSSYSPVSTTTTTMSFMVLPSLVPTLTTTSSIPGQTYGPIVLSTYSFQLEPTSTADANSSQGSTTGGISTEILAAIIVGCISLAFVVIAIWANRRFQFFKRNKYSARHVDDENPDRDDYYMNGPETNVPGKDMSNPHVDQTQGLVPMEYSYGQPIMPVTYSGQPVHMMGPVMPMHQMMPVFSSFAPVDSRHESYEYFAPPHIDPRASEVPSNTSEELARHASKSSIVPNLFVANSVPENTEVDDDESSQSLHTVNSNADSRSDKAKSIEELLPSFPQNRYSDLLPEEFKFNVTKQDSIEKQHKIDPVAIPKMKSKNNGLPIEILGEATPVRIAPVTQKITSTPLIRSMTYGESDSSESDDDVPLSMLQSQ